MGVFNKKAQTGIFFLLMVGIVMFILGWALAPAFVSSGNLARTNLDCSNVSIDTSQKITCGVVDIVAPFLTGIIFAFAGITITAKLSIG
jgi:flagellar basal body-associated protein FliL